MGEELKSNQLTMLLVAGAAGLIGCVLLAATNIAGMVLVPEHNPIADTVSQLAAGNDHAWLQDAGLIAFGVGMIAVGIGVLLWRLDGRRWQAAGIALGLAGGVVFLIAGSNEYGDKDSGDFVIHKYVVGAFALLFAIVPSLMAKGMDQLFRSGARVLHALTISFVVLAPMQLLVPTAYGGLYERLIGLWVIGYVAGVASLLVGRGSKRIGTGRPASAI